MLFGDALACDHVHRVAGMPTVDGEDVVFDAVEDCLGSGVPAPGDEVDAGKEVHGTGATS